MSDSSLCIVNGTTARYPDGGGHFSVRLQYMFGLTALKIDWFWLETMKMSSDPATDKRNIRLFLNRLKRYGFGDRVALLYYSGDNMDINQANIFGASKRKTIEILRSADLMWNFCCSAKEPLLSSFKRRVLIDLDPGHIHASALKWDMTFEQHDVFLTVGSNLQDKATEIPTFNKTWYPFFPVIFLPMWKKAFSDPGNSAPFTSVTQWTWGNEIELSGQLLSTSKRDAYLRYLQVPKNGTQKFVLAANIHPDDSTGDRELLAANGWNLVVPHQVARTPALYRQFIANSRAEFSCPKPVFRELNTGWFSDRSAAYLASGRPVLAEDTGFSDHLPTGRGLLTFKDLKGATSGVDNINAHYPMHQKAAREIASNYFDSRKTLRGMLDAC